MLGAIKGRKAFQTATVYAVVGWLIVQIVVAVESPLSLPDWFDTATIVLVIAGFPIALIFAWTRPDRDGAETIPSERAASAEATSDRGSTASLPAPGTPKPGIKFCTATDGVRIAYATMGSGPPLLKTGNWLSHIELDVSTPISGHLIRDLAARFELTLYDERLNGLSDWEAGEV